MQAVEGSLRRLQTDYIDLYQTHYSDPDVPLDETLRAFDDLVRAGKVRCVGASNCPLQQLAEALSTSATHGWARFDALQPRYNLVERDDFGVGERTICGRAGLAVLPYSPLAGGFLTGKYQPGTPTPPSQRAESVQRRYAGSTTAWRALQTARSIAHEQGKAVSQVALGWLLYQRLVTAPIVGVNTVEQLQELLGATAYRMSAEDVDRLERAAETPDERGTSPRATDGGTRAGECREG